MKTILKTLIFLLIAALLVFLGVRAIRHKREADAKTPAAKSYALRVRTMTPQMGNCRLSLPYIATVRNDRDATLASKLAERILWIADAGTRVKKGEIVVRLDQRGIQSKLRAVTAKIASAKAALEAARSELKTTEAAHERTRKLLAVQGATPEQYEKEKAKLSEIRARIEASKAALSGLEAEREQLKQTLDYATITAPVAGVVSSLTAHEGEMAMPGKALLRLSADRGAYLSVEMPDDLGIEALRYQDRRIPVVPLNATQRGLVSYRSGVLDLNLSTGRRIPVRAVVYEGEGILLPHDAILSVAGRESVFLYQGGRLRRHTIHPLARGEEGVVVSDASLAGKKLIVAKPDILLHLGGGTPVKILHDARRYHRTSQLPSTLREREEVRCE